MTWTMSIQRKVLTISSLLWFSTSPLQSNTAFANTVVNYERGRVISVEPITKKSYRWVPRLTCEEGVTVFYRQSDRNETRQQVLDGEHPVKPSGLESDCRSYRDKEYFEKEVGYNVTFEYLGTLRTVRFDRPPRDGFILLKTEMKVYAIE